MFVKTYTTSHKTWDNGQVKIGMRLLVSARLLDNKDGKIEVEVLDVGDDDLTTLYTYPSSGKHKLVYIDTYDEDEILDVLNTSFIEGENNG